MGFEAAAPAVIDVLGNTFAVDAAATVATDAAVGATVAATGSAAVGAVEAGTVVAATAPVVDTAAGIVGSSIAPVAADTITLGATAGATTPTIFGGFTAVGPMSVPAGTLINGVAAETATTALAGDIVGGSVLPSAATATVTAAELAQGVKVGLDAYGALQKIDAYGKPITQTTGPVVRTGSIPTPKIVDSSGAPIQNAGTLGNANMTAKSGPSNTAIIFGAVVALGAIWYFTKGQHHG